MKIILATRNRGKIEELQALLRTLPVEIVAAGSIAGAPDVEEDGATLEANAEKKAAALAVFTGHPALADDTGLEVAALGGAPGVRSARYAGEDATDADNRRRLLDALTGETNRRARFRTVLAFADGGSARFFEGVCEGEITQEERGEKGFGYDSIFRPDGFQKTFAEMPQHDKNAISHRGRALRAFASFLESYLGKEVGRRS